MWRRPMGPIRTLRSCRVLSVCGFASSTRCGDPSIAPRKLYLIAGEASGDAIGAKVIRALQRRNSSIEFRGIGGPQMCEAGGFESLFPMEELSIMGLVEVLPYLFRFRRRIRDTLDDIQVFKPDLVLTIDSKGFTFRVLKKLQASEEKLGLNRVKKAHYVAPSVWAYKYQGKRDFTGLRKLLDVMFTILPFEEDIFCASDANQKCKPNEMQKGIRETAWCQFVGHPTVEDFLDFHGLYDSDKVHDLPGQPQSPESPLDGGLHMGTDALLDVSKFNSFDLVSRGRLLQALTAEGHELSARIRVRHDMGIPTDALVICALVGSRSNEVKKSLQIVLEAIQKFKQTSEAKHDKQICVIFPTIAAVEHQLKGHVSSVAPAIDFHVIADLDAGARLQLFQSADLAVAVSGTIVLETTLASLPTVVVYRANRVTEWVAKRLAAVRFVSVPNLLLGRSLLPELLFSDFTAPKVAEAMQSLQRCALNQADSFHLAMALSTLTNWKETDSTSLSPGVLSGKDGNGSSTSMQPIRASDLVAKRIIEVLDEK